VKDGKPLDLKSPAVQEHLRSMVFGVKEGDLNAEPTPDEFQDDFYDEDLYQLGKDWNKDGITADDRQSLLEQLFRAAFGEDPETPHKQHYYSFCQDCWI
jgi:hypothetical protein